MNKTPIIFAHKGVPNIAPENTIDSFHKAALFGCDGFECDVHLTRDGIPAVIHDSTIDRTTDGMGKVSDYTMRELQKFNAVANFPFSYHSLKIPALSELISLAASYGKFLLIELKGNYNGLDVAVIEAIANFNYFDKTIISSFNHRYLLNIKNIFPGVKTELDFFWDFYNPVHTAKVLGLYSLCPHYYYLERARINYVPLIKKNNIFLNTFTVNTAEEAERLIEIGVDAFISDEAAALYNKLHS